MEVIIAIGDRDNPIIKECEIMVVGLWHKQNCFMKQVLIGR